jgi:penicillin-binding protein 2
MMSANDSITYMAFSRRAAILAGGTLLAFGGIASRLYYLQVSKSSEYALRADQNRFDARVIVPLRGRLLDRFGQELATNQQDFRVLLIPENVSDIEGTLDQISEIVPISERERKAILRKARTQSKFVPIKVAGHLSWEQFAKININGPELAGVEPIVGDTRFYPYGEDLAHVVGYVMRPSPEDQEDDPHPLLRQDEFRVGKNGVERTIDAPLRGQPGYRHVEVNALGRVVGEVKRVNGQPGDDAVLALDVELQKFAAERMRGESGSAVLLDIYTGEVLALVSTPGFDPNGFNRGWSTKEWKALLENPLKPLVNKSIAGQYPPGSTIKPMIAVAALETGAISQFEPIYCGGKVRLGNHEFHCWKKHGHGRMTMHTALKHSCDVYFYEVARRIGIDRIAEVGQKFGLGKATGLELPGEKSGLMPSRGWKKATTGISWQQGETLITGIGQGYMLMTPLQLAVMTARLANGGRSIKPTLVRSVGPNLAEANKPEIMNVKPEHLQVAMRGMDAVSNEPGGTAYRSRVDVNGMTMAGKTGTAQVRRITKAERNSGVLKNNELPWKFRDHALFTAFAPVASPRYALAVMIEHGGSGSRAAAPVARDIMRETLQRDPAKLAALPPVGRTGVLKGRG